MNNTTLDIGFFPSHKDTFEWHILLIPNVWDILQFPFSIYSPPFPVQRLNPWQVSSMRGSAGDRNVGGEWGLAMNSPAPLCKSTGWLRLQSGHPFPVLTVANLALPRFQEPPLFLALRGQICQWELAAVNRRRFPWPLEVLYLAQASVHGAFFKLSSLPHWSDHLFPSRTLIHKEMDYSCTPFLGLPQRSATNWMTHNNRNVLSHSTRA